jgi:hypothetical protein
MRSRMPAHGLFFLMLVHRRRGAATRAMNGQQARVDHSHPQTPLRDYLQLLTGRLAHAVGWHSPAYTYRDSWRRQT